jgi:hypothetical protein
MRTVSLNVVQVIEDVGSTSCRAKSKKSEQGACKKIRIVPLPREYETGQYEAVLGPLGRANQPRDATQRCTG